MFCQLSSNLHVGYVMSSSPTLIFDGSDLGKKRRMFVVTFIRHSICAMKCCQLQINQHVLDQVYANFVTTLGCWYSLQTRNYK